MSTEREAMTLGRVRDEIAAVEHECHKSALTLGQEGLRGMCIEAQKRLHKLLPAIDAHLAREKAELVACPTTREEMEAYWNAYLEHRADGEGVAIRAGLEAYQAERARRPPAPTEAESGDGSRSR